jgi:hypothetical protein
MSGELEAIACQPYSVDNNGFNPNATLLTASVTKSGYQKMALLIKI